VAFFEKENVE